MSSSTRGGRFGGRREMLVTLAGGKHRPAGLQGLPEAISEHRVAVSGGVEVRRDYPRKAVASVRELQVGEPTTFTYPDDRHQNILVRLGHPAERGVGADADIVAFSQICPHMGCALEATLDMERPHLFGPCRCHFSSFDLSRGGQQVQGMSSQDLPQVLLEVEGDEIVAIGFRGLIYGRNDNLVSG